MSADVAKLPPTQYLILEVLAARHRLGETWWPFPTRMQPAIDALAEAGLVHTMDGNVERTVRVRLSDAEARALDESTYRPPNGGIDRLRRAIEGIAEYAEARADLSIGLDTVAKTARQALGSAS